MIVRLFIYICFPWCSTRAVRGGGRRLCVARRLAGPLSRPRTSLAGAAPPFDCMDPPLAAAYRLVFLSVTHNAAWETRMLIGPSPSP
jgi:hypothetical protein